MNEAFARDGYAGPLRLFDAAECRRIADSLGRRDQPAPEWPKGRAARERLFYELATHPRLLSAVTSILGPDVVLWGASAVRRDPGRSRSRRRSSSRRNWRTGRRCCSTDASGTSR